MFTLLAREGHFTDDYTAARIRNINHLTVAWCLEKHISLSLKALCKGMHVFRKQASRKQSSNQLASTVHPSELIR